MKLEIEITVNVMKCLDCGRPRLSAELGAGY